MKKTESSIDNMYPGFSMKLSDCAKDLDKAFSEFDGEFNELLEYVKQLESEKSFTGVGRMKQYMTQRISLIIAFVYKEQAIHDVAQAMFIASGTFLVFGLITLRSLLKE